MEKSVTINGKIVADGVCGGRDATENITSRKDHVKVWREIYRDVRRQWAEAELNQTGRYRYIK